VISRGLDPRQHSEDPSLFGAQTPQGFFGQSRNARVDSEKSKTVPRRFAATPPYGRPDRKPEIEAVLTKDLFTALGTSAAVFPGPLRVAEKLGPCLVVAGGG